jgi:proline iminopeptidase
MYADVDGARLFFDTVGSHLDPDGAERRTLIVLHGGPGHEHSGLRPYFDRFADAVQVLYLDHRGNGRSRDGVAGDAATWSLARWGDDVAALCDALGVRAPIVYGQSFGGMVAQSTAIRHPGRFGGVVLSSTAARFDLSEVLSIFEELGGPRVREIARRFWTEMAEADVEEYFRVCGPYYTYGYGEAIPPPSGLFASDVLRHFSSTGGEIHRMDHRAGLATVTCPVLVVTGDRDPVTSPARSREIAAALPARARYAEIPDAGHGAYRDQPDAFERILRAFIAEVGGLP